MRGEEKGCNLGYQEIFKKKKPQSYRYVKPQLYKCQLAQKGRDVVVLVASYSFTHSAV